MIGNYTSRYFTSSNIIIIVLHTRHWFWLHRYGTVADRWRKMQLTVKTLKGGKFVINAESTNTILEVKGLIVSCYCCCHFLFLFLLISFGWSNDIILCYIILMPVWYPSCIHVCRNKPIQNCPQPTWNLYIPGKY